MSVKYREETDELPLTAADIFLNNKAVFHAFPESYIFDLTCVVPGHLKG
jgi:hypothetical protein